MTGIMSINRYMDNCTGSLAMTWSKTQFHHQLLIPCGNWFFVNNSDYSLAAYLFEVFNTVTVYFMSIGLL